MATKIKPGRARINAKIMTDTLTMDLNSFEMSEDRAMVIYEILHGAKCEIVNAVQVREAIEVARIHLSKGERNFEGLLNDIEVALNKVS